LTAAAPPAGRRGAVGRFVRRHPTVVAGGALLLLVTAVAVLAPLLHTVDPIEMSPGQRLRPPSAAHWFGTDMYGRDSYSRVVFGSRISLVVGLTVATLTSAIGLGLGVFAGFVRRLDAIVMRVMDGIMALPDLLLAITFVALTGASVRNVVIALVIPQTPRVVRLVRSVVLSLREQPFVEASVALGAGVGRTVLRHVLPNTIAPLIVQGTYVCASAVLIEAALSFLGATRGLDAPGPYLVLDIGGGSTEFVLGTRAPIESPSSRSFQMSCSSSGTRAGSGQKNGLSYADFGSTGSRTSAPICAIPAAFVR